MPAEKKVTMSKASLPPGMPAPGVVRLLAAGGNFLEHFDAVGDGAGYKPEALHRSAWFAGQTNHQRFVDDDREVP